MRSDSNALGDTETTPSFGGGGEARMTLREPTPPAQRTPLPRAHNTHHDPRSPTAQQVQAWLPPSMMMMMMMAPYGMGRPKHKTAQRRRKQFRHNHGPVPWRRRQRATTRPRPRFVFFFLRNNRGPRVASCICHQSRSVGPSVSQSPFVSVGLGLDHNFGVCVSPCARGPNKLNQTEPAHRGQTCKPPWLLMPPPSTVMRLTGRPEPDVVPHRARQRLERIGRQPNQRSARAPWTTSHRPRVEQQPPNRPDAATLRAMTATAAAAEHNDNAPHGLRDPRALGGHTHTHTHRERTGTAFRRAWRCLRANAAQHGGPLGPPRQPQFTHTHTHNSRSLVAAKHASRRAR
jgi:hypothetical protein